MRENDHKYYRRNQGRHLAWVPEEHDQNARVSILAWAEAIKLDNQKKFSREESKHI